MQPTSFRQPGDPTPRLRARSTQGRPAGDAAAAAASAERAGTHRRRDATLAAQAPPVSAYVPLRDRRRVFELTHFATNLARLGVVARSAMEAASLHAEHRVDARGMAAMAFDTARDLVALDPVLYLAQKACTGAIDYLQDRKERQHVRELRLPPLKQLERLVRLANAQALRNEGLADRVRAMQRLQAAYPDDISGFQLAQAIVRLAGHALDLVNDAVEVPVLGPFARPGGAIANGTGLEVLASALQGMAARGQLTRAETIHLLGMLAIECSQRLPSPDGLTEHAIASDLGRRFIDLLGRLATSLPGTTRAEVSTALESLFRADALITIDTFAALVARTTDSPPRSEARLEHLARCLLRTREANRAPMTVALRLATDLLRLNPAAYTGHPDAAPPIRAAEFLLDRLGARLGRQQVMSLGIYLMDSTSEVAYGPTLLRVATGTYDVGARLGACAFLLGDGPPAMPGTFFQQALCGTSPREVEQWLSRQPPLRVPYFVRGICALTSQSADPLRRAQLYVAVADALAGRRDLPAGYSLRSGLIGSQEVLALAKDLARRAGAAGAGPTGALDEPDAPDDGIAMTMAHLVQLGQESNTLQTVSAIVAEIAGLPEFSGAGKTPAQREALAMRLQGVIFEAFTRSSLYILQGDMPEQTLTEAEIGTALKHERARREQELRARSDRKGLDLAEEAELDAQLAAYEKDLRDTAPLATMPHNGPKFLQYLLRRGMEVAQLPLRLR